MAGLQDFFNWYHDNGIIPNLWKGFTGQLSSEKNTSETNNINKQIADENLGYQKELFEYNKALQNQLFEREDTSYQRTANDMIAAGLNPLSMQSTNGSGEVVSQSALNNGYNAQTPQTMSPSTAISAISGVFSAIDSIKTGKLERDALALENDKKQLDNLAKTVELGASKVGNNYILDDNARYRTILDEQLKTLENTTNKSKSESELSATTSQNAQREYEHKVESNKYDSDNQIESYITAIEDWIVNGRGEKAFNKVKESSALANSIDKANDLLQAPKKRYKEVQDNQKKVDDSFEKFVRKSKFGNWLYDKYEKFSDWSSK